MIFDHPWNGVVYNFSRYCLYVYLYVCQTITFERLDIGSSCTHIWCISRQCGSISCMKVIGSKPRSQEQKRVTVSCSQWSAFDWKLLLLVKILNTFLHCCEVVSVKVVADSCGWLGTTDLPECRVSLSLSTGQEPNSNEVILLMMDVYGQALQVQLDLFSLTTPGKLLIIK